MWPPHCSLLVASRAPPLGPPETQITPFITRRHEESEKEGRTERRTRGRRGRPRHREGKDGWCNNCVGGTWQTGWEGLNEIPTSCRYRTRPGVGGARDLNVQANLFTTSEQGKFLKHTRNTQVMPGKIDQRNQCKIRKVCVTKHATKEAHRQRRIRRRDHNTHPPADRALTRARLEGSSTSVRKTSPRRAQEGGDPSRAHDGWENAN